MSIILDSDATKRWRNSLTRAGSAMLPFWRNLRSRASGGSSSSSTTSSTSQSKASYISRWLSRTSTSWTRLTAGAGGHTATSNPLTPPELKCWKEFCLCVDKCWTSVTETKLRTIVTIDSMADDYALFTEARRVLSCARGNRLQRFFSWRSYTRISLSQVTFFSSFPG